MRYKEQLAKLNEAFSIINIDGKQNNSGYFSVKNISNLRYSVNIVKNFKYLNPELENIMSLTYFMENPLDVMELTSQVYNNFDSLMKALKNKISSYIKSLENIVIADSELSLEIKLIEHASIDEIGKELISIDKLINQVITHKKINGSYKFSSFDVGSSWIYIILSSALTLSIIAAIIWSACVIRKKIIEGNILDEKLKQMKLQTSSLEDIKKSNQELISNAILAEALNILKIFDLDNTENEYLNRVKNSIKEFAELINSGVEIHPALFAPEESRNLFPDYSSLNIIESKIKAITEKTK
ncbi:MAG: hypothetical protein FWD40_08285 [Treponema sp.]|nr:hypothetical protein [Treponema sp.]